jgi:hypothetical protein
MAINQNVVDTNTALQAIDHAATSANASHSHHAYPPHDHQEAPCVPRRMLIAPAEPTKPVLVFFVFPSDGVIVRLFQVVCRSNGFEHLVNVLILLNAILLTMEKNYAPQHNSSAWYNIHVRFVDHGFTFLFAIELLCRVRHIHIDIYLCSRLLTRVVVSRTMQPHRCAMYFSPGFEHPGPCLVSVFNWASPSYLSIYVRVLPAKDEKNATDENDEMLLSLDYDDAWSMAIPS